MKKGARRRNTCLPPRVDHYTFECFGLFAGLMRAYVTHVLHRLTPTPPHCRNVRRLRAPVLPGAPSCELPGGPPHPPVPNDWALKLTHKKVSSSGESSAGDSRAHISYQARPHTPSRRPETLVFALTQHRIVTICHALWLEGRVELCHISVYLWVYALTVPLCSSEHSTRLEALGALQVTSALVRKLVIYEPTVHNGHQHPRTYQQVWYIHHHRAQKGTPKHVGFDKGTTGKEVQKRLLIHIPTLVLKDSSSSRCWLGIMARQHGNRQHGIYDTGVCVDVRVRVPSRGKGSNS